MTLNFDEGDSLSLPCRHCASLSLHVAVKSGSRPVLCDKCGKTTQIRIGREGEAWSVRTEALATEDVVKTDPAGK